MLMSTSSLSSLGRKPFENLRLTSGLKTFVGGLEVELDTRITQSEFPKITGKALGVENESESEIQLLEETNNPRPHTENGNSPIKNSTSSGMRFIPPTTFYAKPTPKPKTASPL
jgi:DNA repair and recombination protein RAD54B